MGDTGSGYVFAARPGLEVGAERATAVGDHEVIPIEGEGPDSTRPVSAGRRHSQADIVTKREFHEKSIGRACLNHGLACQFFDAAPSAA